MFTNYQLVDYMEKVYAAGWRYWYGTVGYKCTTDLFNRKKKQYPDHYGASRASGYKADIKAGAMCADCVGVIKSFFWTGGVIGGTSKYGSNNCPDRSANGMFEMCKRYGSIGTIPDVPGLVVWRNGHIGVYVGNGYTIELRGFAYDCQKRKVSAGTWTHWGYLPDTMLTYVEDGEDAEPIELGDRTLRKGMTGDDVRELQRALIGLGYKLPKYGADGDYGNETRDAVVLFQRDQDLDDDGVFGVKSYKALLVAMAKDAVDDGEGAPDGGSEPVKVVKISGGDCWVRNAPNTSGDKLGIAHAGDRLVYVGETAANGWLKVQYKGAVGWVSGKFGRLEE